MVTKRLKSIRACPVASVAVQAGGSAWAIFVE